MLSPSSPFLLRSTSLSSIALAMKKSASEEQATTAASCAFQLM